MSLEDLNNNLNLNNDIKSRDFDFFNLNLNEISLKNNSSSVDLNESNLNSVNLNESNLNTVDLNESDLNTVNLNESNLNTVDLNESDLNTVNLNESDLNSVNLNESDLNSVDLNESNLNSFKNVMVGGSLSNDANIESKIENNIESEIENNIESEIENNIENEIENNIESEIDNDSNLNEGGREMKNMNLDLERGTMVILEDEKEYLICQIKDIYFDNNNKTFVREYKIRELKDEKLLHELIEIKSIDIKKTIDINIVKRDYKDIEYEVNEDKELDMIGNNKNNLERETINNIEEQIVDEDLDIDNNVEDEEEILFDFEELKDDDIVLDIEEELDESKIMFTEIEQEEDILDELIKISDNKFNKKDIRKISLLVRKFVYLKNKYSEISLYDNKNFEELTDNEINLLKQKILVKGRNYKPLLNNYYLNNFKSKYLIPIIQTNLKIYEQNPEKDLLSDEIISEIERVDKIYQKYKNNKELDYDNLNEEVENFLKIRRINNEDSVLNYFRINNDTEVFNNLDINNRENFERIKILGRDIRKTDYEEKIYNKGERINLTGYVYNPNNLDKNNIFLNNVIDNNKINVEEYDEKDIEFEIIGGDTIYEINQKVKICINELNKLENLEIKGKIKKVKRGFIYVEPDDEKLINKNENILEFDTTSKLLKINLIEDIKEPSKSCKSNNKIKVYLFDTGIITKQNIQNILEKIIPSSKNILANYDLNNIYNYDNINELLHKYLLNIKDLDSIILNDLNKIINKNCSELEKKNLKEVDIINKNKKKYNETLLKEQKANKNKEHSYINNKDILNTNDIYEEYIYDKFSFDDNTVRLNWVINQFDYGKIHFYNKLLLKIQDEKTKVKLLDLQNKKKIIIEENNKINDKIEEEKRKHDFFNLDKKDKCREMDVRIVKIYLSLKELENDNYKDIKVDEEFLIGNINNNINLVKINDYCILKNPNDLSDSINRINMNDKIFKRIGVDERDLWVLQSKLKIADFLREMKSNCEMEDCSFNMNKAKCSPSRIDKLEKSYNKNDDLLKTVEKLIKNVDNTNKEDTILYKRDKLIKQCKLNLLYLKNKLEKRKLDYKSFREQNENNILEDIEIDYLDDNIIDYDKLREKYGIDFLPNDVDKEQEIFYSGDFNDKGQRIELTEVMNDNQKTEINEESDIYQMIRSYLDISIKQETIVDENDDLVKKILETILLIMGLNMDNLDKITSICMNMINEQMASIDDFIENKYTRKNKKIPKKSKIEAQYNVYKYQTMIFITCSKLLIYLQLELNNYFMESYSNCVSTLYGYPLTDNSNMDSVNYITCILENLGKSGKYWESIRELGREKIKKRLLAYIDLIVSNINIRNGLDNKNKYIENLKDEYENLGKNYDWHEFRPPLKSILQSDLKSINIDLGDMDIEDVKSFNKSKKIFDEKKMYLSLKLMEKINNVVDSVEIENIKYDPLPLSNMCCLSKINEDYNYLNFFIDKDSNKEFEEILQITKNFEKINNKVNKKNLDLYYLRPNVNEQNLKSYLNVFPKKNEILKNTKLINKLYETFVDEDINVGEKRLYKNNICLLTGKNKIKIQNNNYNYTDYQNLLYNIYKKNIINYTSTKDEENNSIEPKNLLSLKTKNENIEFKIIIENKIKDIKTALNNDLLLENTFIKKIYERELGEILMMEGNYDIKIWDRLEQEINNEKKELLSLLNKNVDKNRLKNMSSIIDNLVRLKNLEDEDSAELEFTNILDKKLEIKKKLKMKKLKRSELFYINFNV